MKPKTAEQIRLERNRRALEAQRIMDSYSRSSQIDDSLVAIVEAALIETSLESTLNSSSFADSDAFSGGGGDFSGGGSSGDF